MANGERARGTVLHNFFRSSTSHRVRIALNVKGIDYRYASYRLRVGDHRSPAYLAINAQGLVPSFELADGSVLTQSLAIIEYLEETVPQPPLLPADPVGRARVRALAHMIALDIHPINNLRVLTALRERFGADEAAIASWFTHWVEETFRPLEQRLAGERETGRFCHGDSVSLADICLVAQVTSNARFAIDHASYPTIVRIAEACNALAPFRAALPMAQPDRE